MGNKRIRRCYKCGMVFDVMEHLQASIEIPTYGVRELGETRNPMEDVIEGELRVKCPYCGNEYQEKRTSR